MTDILDHARRTIEIPGTKAHLFFFHGSYGHALEWFGRAPDLEDHRLWRSSWH